MSTKCGSEVDEECGFLSQIQEKAHHCSSVLFCVVIRVKRDVWMTAHLLCFVFVLLHSTSMHSSCGGRATPAVVLVSFASPFFPWPLSVRDLGGESEGDGAKCDLDVLILDAFVW